MFNVGHQPERVLTVSITEPNKAQTREPEKASATQTTRTMCPMNCHPTLCGMQVTTNAGQLIEIKGDPDNPDSQGFLCTRGRAAAEIIDNDARILHPLARTADGFQRISWDQALTRIVDSMRRHRPDQVAVWACHGSAANDYGVSAHSKLTARFALMAGFQTWSGAMVCWGLGGLGLGLTGTLAVNTKEDMSTNSDLIVQWGSNQASQPNTARHIAIAKKRGARVIAIDVRKSEACRAADDFLLVKPGTDAALALGMMHAIVREGLHDASFIAAHTLGFDELSEHLQSCSPTWAAKICGVEASRIESLAREYANTAKAMLLLGGSSIFKDQHGWQASRAISCLPALTGKLGHPGAGFGPRHGANADGFALNPDILNVKMPARPTECYIPNQVSDIVDGISDGRLQTMLLFGSNLASSFPDSGRVRSGLQAMDLVVAHDLFMNDTIRNCADIVLPATSWLESYGAKATTTHLYLMDKILEPAGEARSIPTVLRNLAERLDMPDFYPWASETGHIDAVLDHPCTGHATVESLRQAGGLLRLDIAHVAYTNETFATPSGKIEFYSEQASEHSLPPLPVYQPRTKNAYPLELRMGRSINHFHSFYDSGRALPSLVRRDPAPELWVSAADAAQRDIADRDRVAIHNQKARFVATAKVTDQIPAGTLWIHDGWPGLNDLTNSTAAIPDTATGLFPFSTGQAAYDAYVELAKIG